MQPIISHNAPTRSTGAEELAFAIDPGARRVGRHWRARCPGHEDKRPSLDLTDMPSGKIAFIDRTGQCTNPELLTLFRERGLWPPEREHTPRRPSFYDRVLAEMRAAPFTPLAPAPECCTKEPWKGRRCEHWVSFEREFLIAECFANLRVAVGELRERAANGLTFDLQVRDPAAQLSAAELREGIEAAIPYGAIAPPELDAATLAAAINVVVGVDPC